MSHYFTGGFSGMVFEHIWDVFEFEDFASDFIQLHQLSSHGPLFTSLMLLGFGL
jgi:hypothetical protein